MVFNQLQQDDMQRIVEMELAKVSQRLAPKHLRLEVGQDVLDYLIETNYNQDFGARPLKRAVERHLEDPLSEAILRDQHDGPHIVHASMKDGAIDFRFEAEPKPEPEPEATAAAGAAAGDDGDTSNDD